MKTSNIVLLIVVCLLLMGGCSAVSNYNSMVDKSENVDAAWSQVENVYQRRADLIPNLVATVKGYAGHEKETLTAVIEARAKATQTKIDVGNINPQMLMNFQAAQDGLSQALSKLMVVVERYPELKANENFRDLQAQLEGTENRIAVERKKFNDSCQGYNTFIRKFPKNIYASIFGFEKRAYFQAEQGAEKAPKVEF